VKIKQSAPDPAALWAHQHDEWRNPTDVISQWQDASQCDPAMLKYHVQGAWWEALAETHSTLLVTREYEHLIMALGIDEGKPLISYLRLPHPSGMAVDLKRKIVHVASTRNPNQVFDFSPLDGQMPRLDVDDVPQSEFVPRPLMPVRSRFYPGSLYLHDLALIGGKLHGNSVGQNAVVHLTDEGTADIVWWPHCIEQEGQPIFGQNHLQLNSIAAGDDLHRSFFSASTDKISARRPGHKNFPVDKRGVIFSGASREPIAHGLTRPHSARLHDDHIWVDNSGYGELGRVVDGQFLPLLKLPGWTRGLAFAGDIAFVGTSRVLPRFRQYAPGVELERSVCGLHAVDIKSGKILGSLIWPAGNQIFAIELVPETFTSGFTSRVGAKPSALEKTLFYTFKVDSTSRKDTSQ